jgi:hypothetical protein
LSIQSRKLNGVVPLAYLTEVLQRIVSGHSQEPRTARAAAVELVAILTPSTA